MTENKKKLFAKILEFGIMPIVSVIIGLTIEYKTGIFQNVVENKTVSESAQTKPVEQILTQTIDSIQSNIFEDGYTIYIQKEIRKYQTDIRVYNEIIKDEKSTSQKIKGGYIYKSNDTVFHKTIGINKVEFFSTSENLFNEIVTIKNGRFYRMRTMYDEYSGRISLTVSEDLKSDYPIEQILINIDNKKNKCTIIGYYLKNQKEKYLKSQKQIVDNYTDLMLFWRDIFN